MPGLFGLFGHFLTSGRFFADVPLASVRTSDEMSDTMFRF
jgi:hypothetical protein